MPRWVAGFWVPHRCLTQKWLDTSHTQVCFWILAQLRLGKKMATQTLNVDKIFTTAYGLSDYTAFQVSVFPHKFLNTTQSLQGSPDSSLQRYITQSIPFPGPRAATTLSSKLISPLSSPTPHWRVEEEVAEGDCPSTGPRLSYIIEYL